LYKIFNKIKFPTTFWILLLPSIFTTAYASTLQQKIIDLEKNIQKLDPYSTATITKQLIQITPPVTLDVSSMASFYISDIASPLTCSLKDMTTDALLNTYNPSIVGFKSIIFSPSYSTSLPDLANIPNATLSNLQELHAYSKYLSGRIHQCNIKIDPGDCYLYDKTTITASNSNKIDNSILSEMKLIEQSLSIIISNTPLLIKNNKYLNSILTYIDAKKRMLPIINDDMLIRKKLAKFYYEYHATFILELEQSLGIILREAILIPQYETIIDAKNRVEGIATGVAQYDYNFVFYGDLLSSTPIKDNISNCLLRNLQIMGNFTRSLMLNDMPLLGNGKYIENGAIVNTPISSKKKIVSAKTKQYTRTKIQTNKKFNNLINHKFLTHNILHESIYSNHSSTISYTDLIKNIARNETTKNDKNKILLLALIHKNLVKQSRALEQKLFIKSLKLAVMANNNFSEILSKINDDVKAIEYPFIKGPGVMQAESLDDPAIAKTASKHNPGSAGSDPTGESSNENNKGILKEETGKDIDSQQGEMDDKMANDPDFADEAGSEVDDPDLKDAMK
jgi:hypothetical protein